MKEKISPIYRMLVCLVGLLGPWHAAHGENLLEIYRLALNNDAQFLAAEAEYRVRAERLNIARSGFLPDVTASASSSHKREKTRASSASFFGSTGDAEYTQRNLNLQITQPLLNFTSVPAWRAAKAEVKQAVAEFNAAKQELALRVAERYFELLSAEINLELARAEQLSIRRQLDLANRRLAAGLTTQTDVHEAQARHELAEAEIINAETMLRDGRAALQEITGEDIQIVAGLSSSTIAYLLAEKNLETWLLEGQENNFRILSRIASVDQAGAELRRARNTALPSFDIVGERRELHNTGSISGPSNQTHETRIGIQMSWPLYQGGRLRAQTREAYQRYLAAKQNLTAEIRLNKREINTSFYRISRSEQRLNALQQAVTARQSNFRSREAGLRAGVNTNIDVLDAQRDLFAARRDYARARYEAILDQLRLANAAGELNINLLNTVNQQLKN